MRKHGMYRTSEFRIWQGMLARCRNPKHTAFHYYGKKGITVCKRWLEFKNFFEDMGQRPNGKSLDRWPNKNGNYEPGNVRWATHTQQMQNQNTTKNNKTGINGVFFSKDRGKYRAQIGVNSKTKHIGDFADLKQAIIARKEAEQEYWGKEA